MVDGGCEHAGGCTTLRVITMRIGTRIQHRLVCSAKFPLNYCETLTWPRFQTIKGSIHSTGAMYATIINNPGAVRFLEEETILVCVIPGPHEPSLEQLNHIIEPFIRDVDTLYGGRSFLCNAHHAYLHYDISISQRCQHGCCVV
jgi:hypothetical protein